MKKIQLSISGIFNLIGFGTLLTIVIMCAGILIITKSAAGAVISLVTAGTLSVWAYILIYVLQKKLVCFTDEVCRTIDACMRQEEVTNRIFDKDTLLDRIRYQLNRLYQIQQADREQIEEQKRNIQTLISDISHQVKTPVTNLRMAADILLEKEMAYKQQEEYLNIINVQIVKLDFLINAMVKSSRLETGVISIKKKQADIYETLAAALGGIYLKAEEKKLKIFVECPCSLIVPHDPKWTEEALFNVLENAVKYTPENGKIYVTSVRWEADTRISIADTGPGIKEDDQGVIFKRFYRGAEFHDIEGIGIGLYLTREIILRQGGRIKVSSEPGKGAVFTIFLPNSR